jgi:serine/threonine protein phosphatase PrpC
LRHQDQYGSDSEDSELDDYDDTERVDAELLPLADRELGPTGEGGLPTLLKELTTPVQQSNMALSVRIGLDGQQGSRHSMEDRVVAFPRLQDEVENLGGEGGQFNACYCAVYDGHNGTKCVDMLKDRLHCAIARMDSFLDDAEQAVISGCLVVDEQVLESDREELVEREKAKQEVVDGKAGGAGGLSRGALMKSSSEECSGACAAIVMLLSTPTPEDETKSDVKLLVAGVGDCRAVLCRRGTAIQLTKLHTASEKEERARIAAADGIVINNRLNGVLAVSRSFGDLAHKGSEEALIAVPQIHQEGVVDGFEFVVLACDGVFDVLTNQEAVNFVRRRCVQ